MFKNLEQVIKTHFITKFITRTSNKISFYGHDVYNWDNYYLVEYYDKSIIVEPEEFPNWLE